MERKLKFPPKVVPVQADVAEQTMLNGVPLGSPGGIVADHDLDTEAVGELFLELLLPQAEAAPLAAPGI